MKISIPSSSPPFCRVKIATSLKPMALKTNSITTKILKSTLELKIGTANITPFFFQDLNYNIL
jgi:hypothetical protein